MSDAANPYDGRNDDDLAVPGLGDELCDRLVGEAPLESDAAPAASSVGAGSSVEPSRADVASAANHRTKYEPNGSVTEWESHDDGKSWTMVKQTYPDRTPPAARRLRVTWVAEYPADPDHYEGCDGDSAKMAALDNQTLLDGDLDLMALVDNAETVELRVEVAR